MMIIMIIIACSMRSDRGDSAKRCGVGERPRESSSRLYLSLFSSLFFSHSLPSRRTPLSKSLEEAMIIITNMIMIIIIMTIYIIIILCDDDDEGDDDDDDDYDKYLFSLESLIFL